MSNLRPINRDLDFLMPPSVDEWLPQRHHARFVAEAIEGLDLRAMTGSGRPFTTAFNVGEMLDAGV